MVPLLDRSRKSLDAITVRHCNAVCLTLQLIYQGGCLLTIAVWQFVLLPLRNTARHGEVKPISGLIYKETRGVLKVFFESAI